MPPAHEDSTASSSSRHSPRIPTDIAIVRTTGSTVINHAGLVTGRLVNSGVKKSGGASVKNGELSEDERNAVKLIKFFAVW